MVSEHRLVGLLPCTLVFLSPAELAMQFLPMAPTTVRQALVRDLYTTPMVQVNRHAHFAFWPVVNRLGRLLLT